MRTHFICDQKWRDLPTIAALKTLLEARGVRVTAASSKETFALLPAIRPDAVVFNHMFGGRHQRMAARLRKAGAGVIVLPTEGKGEPAVDRLIWGDFNDFSNIDLFLSWNERAARNLVSLGRLPPEAVKVVGCTRYDYYRNPWFGVAAGRADFCRRHDLDARRPIVTWTTKFGYARIHGNAAAERAFAAQLAELNVVHCYDEIGFDWRRLPQVHHDNRIEQAKGFFELARRRPEIQFVVKPHPTEERAFYESRIAQIGLKNVRLVYGEYIWDVLDATDVLLQQRCSTALEAWLLGKPTIEMKLHDERELAWPEYEAGSHKAESVDQMVDLVDRFLAAPETVDPAMLAAREEAAREFAWQVDGRRSHAAADAIVEFLGARAPRTPKIRLSDVEVSLLTAGTVLFRHVLGVKASLTLKEHFFGLSPVRAASVPAQLDKEVTHHDIRRYCDRLRELGIG
jgi:surface carbohydrate biosynthesis protein